MGFFKEFHENNMFVRSLNSTFLVLVPKNENAMDIKDFRPIKLVRGLYKILAKDLANRLKKVVGQVVSTSQNAFVEGRQILDAALIANESIDSLIRRKEKRLLCKLDIEKVYDHLNLDFLFQIMEKMGFGRKWLIWIRWCISTSFFSLLVNGTPSSFFRSSSGLRKGDPLSLYLFVITMEALSYLIGRAVERGFLSGCRICGRNGEGVVISHLLYADDTILFCGANQDQMMYLSWLLMWFEAISGLRINLNKSEIIPMGKITDVDALALELGCKVGALPSSYLGAPHNSVAVWDGIEERFRKRLTLWKRRYISKGGRLTLIQSTLSCLLVYFMSLFHLPIRVTLRLEQIQKDFMWGRGNMDKKPHLVKWSMVCANKRNGGLGVRNLSILNRALLCKWIWRFTNEKNALWRNVICWKFGEEQGGWVSGAFRGASGTRVWKEIRKKWDIAFPHAIFSLRNGIRLHFSKDIWCREEALCDSFPSLYALANNKKALVADPWDSSRKEGGWAPLFIRSFNDWELDEILSLLNTIQGKQIIES